MYNIFQIQSEKTKFFSESGYVLQSQSEQKVQNVERYYFSAKESYQNKYNQKVLFKDTNGDKIVIDKNNFLHYTNGSMSALTKGVIMDLANIESDPILYYTIQENMILRKNGDKYSVKHLNQQLDFTNFIWKIEDEKYLICGSPINIHFPNGEIKEINGYIELEYADNEVVKIYNQEVTYQTVSSNLYLTLPDEIKINISNKIVSKNHENKMSLENMIINSDDNVEIVDIEEEKYKEKTEENEVEENKTEEENQTNKANNTSNENNSGNGQGNHQQNEAGIGNVNGNGNDQEANGTIEGTNNGSVLGGNGNQTGTGEEGNETVVEETPQVIAPVFKVEELEVDSISMQAKITIQDDNSTLVGNPLVKILKNDTAKTVYEKEESSGVFSLDVSVSSLVPDTEYTLVVQDTYQVEEAEYTKNFVYKVFRTKSAGIDFEKDYFTNNTLAFQIKLEEDSKVKGAEMIIMNQNGEIEQTRKIDSTQTKSIEFIGLNSNTNYTVGIINVLYDGEVITNGFQMHKTFQTLKEKPEISGTQFEIDKRNGQFKIGLQNMIDPDNGIRTCRYEIYDTRVENEETKPVLTIETNKNEQVTIPVDGNKILRGVPYVFKLVATFYDNEKEIEYESEYSDVMKMDGVEFPTVRFEEKNVTFERIEGLLVIEDDSNTIDLSNNHVFTITYTDSVGVTASFTSSGSLKIPVSIYGLRANETYKFSIYGTVNLQDGNDAIEQCYIGGAIVKTKIPQNLKAMFAEESDDVKNTFNVEFQLQNDTDTVGTLEADTLSGMTFRIYAGQAVEGSPIRTKRVVDSDIAPYISLLKEEYYDKSITLTPEFFGATNRDFRDKYYTITVDNAYDYTQYQNKIPIVSNVYVVETNGFRPDLPTDIENALDVVEIRNRDKDQREELDASMVVGYRVTAKYNNSDLYARKIIYKAYDANTNELIETKEVDVGENGVIPQVEFELGDGTPSTIKDTDQLRRGNRYYFTYEALLDLNSDGVGETIYPYEEEGVVLKSRIVAPIKQEPKIEMYPSTSTGNTVTYKYKASDIDHALQNNQMVASIGNNIRDTRTFETQMTEEYQEITFGNLIPGNISLNVTQILNKNEFAQTKQITEYYFEGKVTLDTAQYNVSLDSNKVIITLLNIGDKLNRIASVSVEFVGEDKTLEKEFLYPENNMIVVNLNELAEFVKQSVTVNVYAYYDTGLIGFDMESEYKLLQKAYKTGEENYYYTLNNEKNLGLTPTAAQNMYQINRTGTSLAIIDPRNPNNNADIQLMQISGGFAYEYDLIQQKEVKKEALKTDGSNVISFDVIIPGIRLMNEAGELNITSELDRVELKASIISQNFVNLQDDLIYIELYKTDDNGNNEEFVKIETRKLQDFDEYITINGLEPKNYYFIRFKTNIVLEDGRIEEKYLYDMDYQVLGKNYYFSTLANVGITDVKVVYNPVTYRNKTVDITYQLDRIFGYQKIVYTIQKWKEETQQYETVIDNIQDTLFKKEMLKQIESNPGSVFEFGKNYKLIIRPIAQIENEDGTQRELELGIVEHEFKLQELKKPLVGINAARPTNDSINFRITLYDEDRTTQNDEYTIKVLNHRQEDITPEEYAGQKFSTNLLNNIIRLEQIDPTKEYSIEIITLVDYDNDGKDLVEVKKTYTMLPINSSGISLGKVTTSNNKIQKSKIDLVFNNSYKLTEIDQIRYSIYNINGYSISGTQDFIPTETIVDGESIYTFTIDKSLREAGRYYMEIQFLKDNEIVETCSLEHTYLEE